MTDRWLTGLMLVVVLAIVGTLVYRAQSTAITSVAREEAGEVINTEARSTQVKAFLYQCDRTGGGKTLARGAIRNIGNVDLHYVSLKVLWMNSAGLVIEASELYALNDEVLAPGAEKAFTDVTEKASAVRCNVETVDWW